MAIKANKENSIATVLAFSQVWLLAFKVGHLVEVSWWWVFTPMYIALAIAAVMGIWLLLSYFFVD